MKGFDLIGLNMRVWILTILFCSNFFYLDFGHAEKPLAQKLQEAVMAENCDKVLSILPKLVDQQKIYLSTLGNFYKKGFCFPQDYQKSYKAYERPPIELSTIGLYEMALMHLEGRGVKEDQQKAKELFQQAIDIDAIRSVDFSEIRGGLEIILKKTEFPEMLEGKIKDYEEIENDLERKIRFTINYIEKTDNPELKERGYNLLINLDKRYNHAEASYLVSKYYSSKGDADAARSYLFSAARNGFAHAQADIGRKFFFEGDTEISTSVRAYEMLLRAQKSGIVSQEEIDKVSSELNEFQIEFAKEEAAKPLPHN